MLFFILNSLEGTCIRALFLQEDAKLQILSPPSNGYTTPLSIIFIVYYQRLAEIIIPFAELSSISFQHDNNYSISSGGLCDPESLQHFKQSNWNCDCTHTKHANKNNKSSLTDDERLFFITKIVYHSKYFKIL